MAACLGEKLVNAPVAQIGDCSVESCLTSATESPRVSMVGQQNALKKRHRPVFGEGEVVAWDGDMKQEPQWVSSAI